MILPKEIYIVVCEHDGSNDGIPIAVETYINERCSSREVAEHRAALEGCRSRYGEVKIGRLVMDDEEIAE